MNINIYEKNVKTNILSDIQDEYIDRIKKYCNIEILKNKFTSTNKEYIINISNTKNTISSLEFAKKISDILINGYSNIVFLRNENISVDYDYELSVTDISTSYEIEGIVLLEQIYRAFKINNNEVYHK